MKGCLEGIRVLELGNFISGPYGAMLLADLGAEVIKVENPKGGDPFRGWDFGGDQPNFWAYNRGKKSVTLNLQTPEGKEIFYGLVKARRRGDGQLSSRRHQEARHRLREPEKNQRKNCLLLDHRHRPIGALRETAGLRHGRSRHGRHDERSHGPAKSRSPSVRPMRTVSAACFPRWEFSAP